MTDEEWNNIPCSECSGNNKKHDVSCPYWECSFCGRPECSGTCEEDYDDHALDEESLYE